jgi:hypothetical protein
MQMIIMKKEGRTINQLRGKEFLEEWNKEAIQISF